MKTKKIIKSEKEVKLYVDDMDYKIINRYADLRFNPNIYSQKSNTYAVLKKICGSKNDFVIKRSNENYWTVDLEVILKDGTTRLFVIAIGGVIKGCNGQSLNNIYEVEDL